MVLSGVRKGSLAFLCYLGAHAKIQNSTTGVARIYLKLDEFLESSYLYYLGAHAKIQNSTISLSRIYLKLCHFPVKIGLIWGVGGVHDICFSLESSSFCYLGGHAKFQNPSCLLSNSEICKIILTHLDKI